MDDPSRDPSSASFPQGQEMAAYSPAPAPAPAAQTSSTAAAATSSTPFGGNSFSSPSSAAAVAANTSADSETSSATVVVVSPPSSSSSSAPPATTTAAPAPATGGGGAISFFKRYSGWGLHSSSSTTPTATAATTAVAPTDSEVQPGPATPLLPEVKIESEVPPSPGVGAADDPPSQRTLTAGDGASSNGSSSSGGASSLSVDPRAGVGAGPGGSSMFGGARSRLDAASAARKQKGRHHHHHGQPHHPAGRPCQTHSFHTDAAEVQHMEKGLLKLLDDFNSGKLRAFGQGCSMEQMEVIRDQQESLAKLHFELGARQEIFTPLSEDGLRASNENMDLLMSRLEKLSISIGRLNPAAAGTPDDRKDGEESAGITIGEEEAVNGQKEVNGDDPDR